MIGLPPLINFGWQGIGFGFLAGVTIGPFLGYVINVVLTYGWRRSLPLISIPLLVDAPIIIVMVFVLGQLPDFVRDLLSIIGGSFTVWLGITTWRQNRKRIQKRDEFKQKPDATLEIEGVGIRGSYFRGLLVNALNPAPYLFWSTVSGPILVDALDIGGIGFAFAFLIGYYITFLMLIYVLMRIIDRIGALDDQMDRYLMPITVLLMLVLGGGLIIVGLIDLFGFTKSI